MIIVIGLSFVLPGVFGSKNAVGSQNHPAGVPVGTGLPVGSSVPSFQGTNLLTGQQITSASIYNQKTLLFFSEGVSCQACLVQIQGLQQVSAQLAQKGIQLVSITPDPPNVLSQAVSTYGITTPVISDENLTMSKAFNTLGLGMHADTPGHAFALVYHGKVLWYRDFWLAPYRTMYVEPKVLLADLP